MRIVLRSCVVFLVLLCSATAARADVYGTVAEQMRTLQLTDLTAAHDTVLAQPASDQRTFFLACTSLINAIVDEDGSGTMAEIMRLYGLEFVNRIDVVNHIISGGVDLHRTSTKDFDDFRVFLQSWKSNVDSSLTLLNQLPTSFEYTMTLPDGTQVQLDYTDVLAVKCGLQVVDMFIELFGAHTVDGNMQDAEANPGNYIQSDTFLGLRADSAGYLAAAKGYAEDALASYRAMLESVRDEAATPVGEEECFIINPASITDQLAKVDALISSLNSGSAATLFDGLLGVLNLNVVFDGGLSFGDILPLFEDEEFVYSTFGRRLGNDATFNGMFPNATQKAWNMEMVSRLQLFPYVVEEGAGAAVDLTQTLTPGSFSGTFQTVFNWEETTVNLSMDQWGLYMWGDGWADLFVQCTGGSGNKTVSYLVGTDKVVFREVFDEGAVEYTVYANGDIDVSTTSTTPITVTLGYSSADFYRDDEYWICGSWRESNSIRLRNGSGSTATAVNLAPLLHLLLGD